MLDFVPFTIRKKKKGKLFTRKFAQNDFKNALQYLHLNYASCNVKFDSLTFIYFQENYQTAKIYFYLYHVIPLDETISNYFVR